ncbi:MAG: histidine phosphatase family protein [Campylobacterales bacterium]|nr:histidine phosphatase family protein [Campylobacterales bacterium]
MKEVYLVRHGKSSWKDILLKDFDRPLNKRGKRDVPFMSSLLKENQIIPDLIISSPAKRAKKTAEGFSKKLGVEVVYDNTIYDGDVSDLMEIIKKKIKKYDKIFIVGHNPTLTDTANSFLDDIQIDNIPTSGVVGIDLLNNKMLCFEYPKKYQQTN